MWIDILFLIVVIISIWKGWQHGLIITIFTMLAWILGIIGALKLCSTVSILLRDHLNLDSRYTPVISFIAIFLIIALIISILGKLLTKVIEVAQLGFFNRALGVLVRVIVSGLVFSLFIWLINQGGFISPETKTQSKTYAVLESLANHSIGFTAEHLPVIKSIFTDIEAFFEELAKKTAG